MNRKRKLAGVLIACLLAAQMGCERQPYLTARDRKTIGAVLKTMDAEYWQEIRSGMEQAAAETGVRLIVQWPSDETQSREQERIARDMLAQDIDVLLYAPCDSRQTAWLDELAQQRQIPVLAVDTDAADCEFSYIGSDNRGIGHMAYQYLSAHLPAGSRVGMIAGDTAQQSISDRVTGMRFYCEHDQTLLVADVTKDCKNYADAYAAACRQMTEQEVDALFCTSAVLGLGAAGARTELGRPDVQIICVDTQEDALRSLQLGGLDAIITQSGYEIGYQAVQQAACGMDDLRNGSDFFIPNALVTADNIAEYLGEMDDDK